MIKKPIALTSIIDKKKEKTQNKKLKQMKEKTPSPQKKKAHKFSYRSVL